MSAQKQTNLVESGTYMSKEDHVREAINKMVANQGMPSPRSNVKADIASNPENNRDLGSFKTLLEEMNGILSESKWGVEFTEKAYRQVHENHLRLIGVTTRLKIELERKINELGITPNAELYGLLGYDSEGNSKDE